jgi:hypothetical protein
MGVISGLTRTALHGWAVQFVRRTTRAWHCRIVLTCGLIGHASPFHVNAEPRFVASRPAAPFCTGAHSNNSSPLISPLFAGGPHKFPLFAHLPPPKPSSPKKAFPLAKLWSLDSRGFRSFTRGEVCFVSIQDEGFDIGWIGCCY